MLYNNTTGFTIFVQLFDLIAQLYIFGSIALVLILFFDHLFSSLSVQFDEHHQNSRSPEIEIDFYDQIKELFSFDSDPEQIANPP
jgi:hypothetical protein